MPPGVYKRPDALTRFWAKVKKVDGHWIWQGRPNAHGYGRITVDGVLRYAHSYSYEIHVGPIPEGLEIDHLCRIKMCVKPECLEATAKITNTMRGDGPAAKNRRKSHCARAGHPL